MIFKKFTTLLLATSILTQSIAPSIAMDMPTPDTAPRIQVPTRARAPQPVASLGYIDESNIDKLYTSMHPDWTHLSPVNGLLMLNSELLTNIRFHGRYGPLNPKFLCHYQITNPPHPHAPTAHRDSPQDYTTSVVQQLFPSPAGGMLALPGVGSDFFKVLLHTQIAELLCLYAKLKTAKADHAIAYNKLLGLFNNWLCPENTPSKSWIYPKGHRAKLQENWAPQGITLEILAQKYAEIFAGSLSESDRYPEHFVESALLSFVWKKSRDIKEVKNLFLTVLKKEKMNLGLKGNQRLLTKENYLSWKEKALNKGKITDSAFEDLLKNPEFLVFMTLGYDHFDNPFPKLLGTGEAIYTYIDSEGTEKTEKFSDCGEAALLTFFNIVFGNPYTRTFNLDALKEAYPDVSPKLIVFFEEVQPTFDHINEGIVNRSKWADVVSGLNKPEDPFQIEYEQAEGRCNIAGSGIDNILMVLEKLLNAPVYSLFPEELNAEKRRAKIMSHFLESLSNGDSSSNEDSSEEGDIYTWQVKGQSDSLESIETLTILKNDEKLFNWHFFEGHYEFNFFDNNNMADWRQNKDSNLGTLLASSLNPALKSQLFPFYLKSDVSAENLITLLKENEGKFLPEMIYGMKQGGSEQTLESLDKILGVNPEFIRDLAPRWLESLPADTAVNHMIVSFIFKHRDFFNESHFTPKAYPRIFPLYKESLQGLQTRPMDDVWYEYMEHSPYCEDLLIHLLEKRTAEEVIALRYSKEDGPDLGRDCEGERKTLLLAALHAAMVRGQFDLTTKILAKTGSELINISWKGVASSSPLNFLLYNRHRTIPMIKLLLEYGATINKDIFNGLFFRYEINGQEGYLKDTSSVVKLLIEYGADLSSEKYTFVGSAIAQTATDEEFYFLFPLINKVHYQKMCIFNRCLPLFKTNPEFLNKYKNYFDFDFFMNLAKYNPEDNSPEDESSEDEGSEELPTCEDFNLVVQLNQESIESIKKQLCDYYSYSPIKKVFGFLDVFKIFDTYPSVFEFFIKNVKTDDISFIISKFLNNSELTKKLIENDRLQSILLSGDEILDTIKDVYRKNMYVYNDSIEPIKLLLDNINGLKERYEEYVKNKSAK